MRRRLPFWALEPVFFLGLVPLLAMSDPMHALRRLLLFAGCAYALFRLRGKVTWRRVFARPSPAMLRGALVRGALAAILILAFVVLCDPEHLLDLPRRRPGLWLLIFCLYPLLSALPQEIIYRLYVFEAFAPLRASPWAAYAFSVATFAWVHVIYAGWFAVAASGLAGLFLAGVYVRRRNEPGLLWGLVLEHSIYGLAVFTLGLGRWFFISR